MAQVNGLKTVNKTSTLFSNTSKEGIDDDITYGYDSVEDHTVQMIIGILAACIAIILCMVVFMVIYLWRMKKASEKGAEAAARERRAEINPGIQSGHSKAAVLDQGIQEFVREQLSRYEDLLAHNASRSPQVHHGEVPRWSTGAAASISSSAGVPGGINLPRVQIGAIAPGGSSLQQMGTFAPRVGNPQVGAFAPSSGTSLQSRTMRAFAPNAPSPLRGPVGRTVQSWASPQRGQVGTDAQVMTLLPQLGLIYTKELRRTNSQQRQINTDELSKRSPQRGQVYTDELSKRSPQRGQVYTDELSKRSPQRGQVYTDELSKRSPQRGQVYTDELSKRSPQRGQVYTDELSKRSPQRGQVYTDELSKGSVRQQENIYTDELSKRSLPQGHIYTDELSRSQQPGRIYTNELSKNLHQGQTYTDELSRSPQRAQLYANTLNRSLQRGQIYTEELLGSSPLKRKIGTSTPTIPRHNLMGTMALGWSAQQRQSGAGALRQSADYAARVRHTGILLPRDPWRKYESEPIYENTNLRRMEEHGYMAACRV